jgi:hypothetical protein
MASRDPTKAAAAAALAASTGVAALASMFLLCVAHDPQSPGRSVLSAATHPRVTIVVAPRVLPDANVTPNMEGVSALPGQHAVMWSLATAVIVIVLTSRGVSLSRIGSLYGP